METLDLLRMLISEKIRYTDKIVPEATMKELGLDSLDLVEVILAAEEKLDIVFDDDELMDLHTIQDVINLIERKKK